jgi:hypothetical protein
VLDESVEADAIYDLDDQMIEQGQFEIPQYEENQNRLGSIQPGDHDNPLF